MSVKLFASELKIMDLLWKLGDTSAKRLSELLEEQIGWSRTTTYTVIKKCIDKGAIRRIEPGFLCHALVTREQAQAFETAELIERLYDGQSDLLVASLLGQKRLSADQLRRLRQMIEEMGETP
jgi:predicted transcriptional regulator